MADIAILVAEEYERRMKKSRKLAGGGAEAATGAAATTTTVAVSGGATAALAESLRGMNWVKKAEEVCKDLEPKSQMGVAAFSGLFSA